MDPKLVKLAKEVPSRLKQIMNDMFEASEPALRTGVSTLRQSLSKLDTYLQQVEKEHLGSATTTAKAAPTTGVTVKKTRRRRGGKRFQTGPFVVDTLKRNPKGLRPVDVAKALSQAAPGQHKSALSVVNSTLARLKGLGTVQNRKGIWSVRAA